VTQDRTALLLIDVVNPLDFPEADALARHAIPAAERVAALKRGMKASGATVVYVNDNFGDWSSDFSGLVRRVRSGQNDAARIVELLAPEDDDLYVLKPRHSGFYATPLDELLRSREIQRLVLCGFQTHMCVLFTAHDAYIRQYDLRVPADGSASERPELHRNAMALLDELGVDIAEIGDHAAPDFAGIA